jgi:proline iminopeptidase
MLPSHLIDASLRKNERQRHTRLGDAPPPPAPSLCITGAMPRVGRFEVSPGIVLAYCIFRPRQLTDVRKAPLIVLHGGPSIPSNYLLPIVNGVTDRSIVYYDMWGCGKSSRPLNGSIPFSIDKMVEHVQLLIQHWKVSKFHLYGHSFGGIVAYEYLKKRQRGCLSLILGSTPTSPLLIQEECQRLDQELSQNTGDQSKPSIGEEEEEDDNFRKQQSRFSEAFLQTHECRLPALPLVLTDALAQAGPPSWRGIQAIAGYEASETISSIPTMVLVGEFDFCTPLCTEGWKTIIQNPSPQYKTLKNCSHYGMLEDESQYDAALTEFVQQND